MRIVPRSSIQVGKRQRSEIKPSDVNERKESIAAQGLLSPPSCFELVAGDDLTPSQYLLIAGETRLKAIDALAEEGRIFSCDRQPIAPGEVPILLVEAETLLMQQQVELDENLQRTELSWQDKARALATIHSLRLGQNPDQTFKQTGDEIAAKTGGALPSSKDAVRTSVLVAEHLNDPTIANARNAREAQQLIYKKEEERANSILAKRNLLSSPTKPEIEIRHGDLEAILPILDEGQFDLILADPPYGINASGGGFRGRTVHHHNYEDTPEYARQLLKCILVEGFRISRPRANLFLFTDVSHWDWLQNISAQIGWTPFRRPLIWGKSDSEGLAPWGASGPRITTDFIFYATKGQRGMLASPIDYLRVNRVPRNERIHAAEKPVELMRKLLECTTLAGEKVLDCCCGSGSTLVACREMGRKALGIEKDETYYNTAMSNVYMGKQNVV